MRLIGLVGYPGVGKDEAAKALTEDGWKRLSFADNVRAAALGIDPIVTFEFDGPCRLSDIVKKVGWDIAKRQHPEVRRLLQRIGTEGGRDIHGHDCWVELIEIEVDDADIANEDVVITDVRFENEVQLVQDWGGCLVWVEKPGCVPVNDHKSERKYEWLHENCQSEIINDGDVEGLHAAIRQLVDDL